jgi:hypothetical protein
MAKPVSGKKKSGFPWIVSGCIRQPRIPALTKIARNRNSVLRFPRPRIAPIARERASETFSNPPLGS